MEELAVKSALLNIVDSMNVSVASGKELDLSSSDTYTYIERCLNKMLDDCALKKAEFREGSNFLWRLRQYREDEITLAELTQYIVSKFDGLMKQQPVIPSGDLLTGIVGIDGRDCLYLLKLNYRAGYTHHVRSEDGFFIELIRHQAILPPAGGRADEGALISLEDFTVQVLEKPCALTDGRRCYFAPDLLESLPSPSVREVIKVLDEAVDKVNSELNEPRPGVVPALKEILCQKVEVDEEVTLNDLIDEVFVEQIQAREAVREELTKAGVPQKVRIRETQAQKMLSRQKISTDIGVELNLPVSLYHDPNTIEFINQPDGTLSILIKGIGKLIHK